MCLNIEIKKEYEKYAFFVRNKTSPFLFFHILANFKSNKTFDVKAGIN